MKQKNLLPLICLFTSIGLFSCVSKKELPKIETGKYTTEDKELYQTIVKMDSVFFDAYNTCDLKKQAAIYADDIEFYHDKGGLSTSKTDIIAATEKNICGKVTRTLIKGSVEVYPIKDFGAIEIGYHKFFNNQEPDEPAHPSKFIIFWNHLNNEWKITKVVSLH
jgi:hypothetical protein